MKRQPWGSRKHACPSPLPELHDPARLSAMLFFSRSLFVSMPSDRSLGSMCTGPIYTLKAKIRLIMLVLLEELCVPSSGYTAGRLTRSLPLCMAISDARHFFELWSTHLTWAAGHLACVGWPVWLLLSVVLRAVGMRALDLCPHSCPSRYWSSVDAFAREGQAHLYVNTHIPMCEFPVTSNIAYHMII